jgi:mannitol/fructose-specific phosphotransferase system IIA component (Ntr-type)
LKLSEVLAESAIQLDLDGRDKWQAIEELTDRLVATDQLAASHRDRVHAALVAREKSMSTGMEQGIAIPHTSVPDIERTGVALGISRSGIEFQAIDGRLTHLVILLVNPANRTKDHIRTLAEIARLLSSSELRADLVRSESAAHVLETIRAAESVAT